MSDANAIAGTTPTESHVLPAQVMAIDYASQSQHVTRISRRLIPAMTIALLVQIAFEIIAVSTLFGMQMASDLAVQNLLWIVGQLLLVTCLVLVIFNIITRRMALFVLAGRLVASGLLPLLLSVVNEITMDKAGAFLLVYRFASLLSLLASNYLCLFIHDAWSDSREFGRPV